MTQHIVAVGASRGLGKAFVAEASGSGHVVSAIARTADGPGMFSCNITDADDVHRTLEIIHHERGPINSLAFFQRFRGEGDPWQEELQTSLTATKSVIEASLPFFATSGERSIVVVSSIASHFVAADASCSYHVAKAGLCQLARYFAVTLGSQGIRVNAVCPGTFVKPESQAHYQSQPDVVRRLSAASPLNRMGTHLDVIHAILFLLSEKAAFITGQSLYVDGGVSLRWPGN